MYKKELKGSAQSQRGMSVAVVSDVSRCFAHENVDGSAYYIASNTLTAFIKSPCATWEKVI